MQMMLASGASGPINPIPITQVSDSKGTPALAVANVTVGSDGALSYTGVSSIGGAAWFRGAPITAVGADYHCRLTVESGDVPNNGGLSAATIYSLASSRTFGLQTAGGVLSGSWTLAIATDNAMANIVASGTFSAYAEST